MELGISTVVVLVIAMVIIAGGIAFIRGFFKKGTVELEKGFDLSELGTQPTGENPLVLSQGKSITIKAGDEIEKKIGFFNNNPVAKNTKIIFGSCTFGGDPAILINACGTSSALPIITSVPKVVESGDSFGFVTLVKASCLNGANTPKLPAGKYICNLQASDIDYYTVLAETQFIFEVTP
jgi:hypothetical protein